MDVVSEAMSHNNMAKDIMTKPHIRKGRNDDVSVRPGPLSSHAPEKRKVQANTR